MQLAKDERRGEPRFAMRLPVIVKTSNGEKHEENTFTLNVSRTGIFFYLSRELHPGENFEITLSLPPGNILSMPIQVNYSGHVVRMNSLDDGAFGVAAAIQSKGFVAEA